MFNPVAGLSGTSSRGGNIKRLPLHSSPRVAGAAQRLVLVLRTSTASDHATPSIIHCQYPSLLKPNYFSLITVHLPTPPHAPELPTPPSPPHAYPPPHRRTPPPHPSLSPTPQPS